LNTDVPEHLKPLPPLVKKIVPFTLYGSVL